MFQQAKGITNTTSNHHPNQIIQNVLQRVQEESKATSRCTYEQQESEIKKLAATLPPKVNTFFPWSWISKHSSHYQAHLERISDYLQLGGKKQQVALNSMTVCLQQLLHLILTTFDQ